MLLTNSNSPPPVMFPGRCICISYSEWEGDKIELLIVSSLHHVSVMPTMRGLEVRRRWRSGILLHMEQRIKSRSTAILAEALMFVSSKGEQ